jgi:RNA polymerase sigma factor (sigma-70 family)
VGADWVETVRSAQAGDDAAYGRLVEALWVDLVRLARSIVGEGEAEDVVQDSLVVAWRSLGQLRDPRSVKSWLTRSVFRRCLWRARWRRVGVALHLVAEPAGEADPVSELTLAQLLAHLAPRQRAVLHMTVVEGMTDTEVSLALGLSPGTVRAHRRRAREHIARILSEEGR